MLAALAVALFAGFQFARADGHEHITLSIGDSDNVIGDNQEVTLTVTINNTPTDDDGTNRPGVTDYSYKFVAIPAALPTTATPGDDAPFAAVADTDNEKYDDDSYKFFVPKGTTGEFSISVRVQRDTVAALGETVTDPVSQKNLDKSITFKVGEAGTDIASAELSLGKVGHSVVKTAKTDAAATSAYGDNVPLNFNACNDDPELRNAKPDPTDSNDTDAVDGIDTDCIAVTVSVKNSLGNAANGGDVTGIHVFAPLATVIYDSDATDDGSDDAGPQSNVDRGDGTAQLAGGAASVKFYVVKKTPGQVDVTAIVLGRTGSTTSAPLPLLFTGNADSIALGEADSALAQNGTSYAAAEARVDATANDGACGSQADDTPAKAERPSSGEARVEVTATDASGNKATLTPAQLGDIEITDADGELVTTIDVTPTPQEDAKGVVNPFAVRLTLNATDADPGTYTLSVGFGDNDAETVEIVVAGKVADVALETSAATVEIGDIITLTATVTDADGNLSPDVGAVMFQAVGALDLNALGVGATGGNVSVDLDDGSAEARFVVVSGSGTATIIASTAGVDAVTSVSTEAAEAMPEEEASVGCLSNLAGFATWACGVESSASEIFGLVSGRGATALHLWNGSAWVRYSVVDGTMVPGSSDFMVAENDILYISN